MDCFAVLAKTWMGPICQHDTPSLRGALATKQSILSLRRYGLLRCARKDVDGVHLPTRYSVIARSSCDEAIHTFFVRRYGLLRCARKDVDGVHRPTRYSVIARSSCDEAIHTFFAAAWIASAFALRATADTSLR